MFTSMMLRSRCGQSGINQGGRTVSSLSVVDSALTVYSVQFSSVAIDSLLVDHTEDGTSQFSGEISGRGVLTLCSPHSCIYTIPLQGPATWLQAISGTLRVSGHNSSADCESFRGFVRFLVRCLLRQPGLLLG